MTKPLFCTNCFWSESEKDSSWNLRCVNPDVNAKDAWALANKFISGTDCRSERERHWYQFPACGKAGKRYKSKLDSDPKL